MIICAYCQGHGQHVWIERGKPVIVACAGCAGTGDRRNVGLPAWLIRRDFITMPSRPVIE